MVTFQIYLLQSLTQAFFLAFLRFFLLFFDPEMVCQLLDGFLVSLSRRTFEPLLGLFLAFPLIIFTTQVCIAHIVHSLPVPLLRGRKYIAEAQLLFRPILVEATRQVITQLITGICIAGIRASYQFSFRLITDSRTAGSGREPAYEHQN